MPGSRLPTKSDEQELGAEGERWVCGVFPASWSITKPESGEDFGMDLLVEVFDRRHPTGWVFEVQVKATNDSFPTKDPYPLSVPTQWLNYALTRPNPVVLVRFFGVDKRALWVWVKEYANLRLAVEKPTWDTQKTVTIHIPLFREFGRGSLGEIIGYLSSGGAETICDWWRRLVEITDLSRESDPLAVKPLPVGAEHLARLERVLPVEVRPGLHRVYRVVSGAEEQRLMPRDDIEFAARTLPRMALWAAQQRSKMTQCLSNLKQLALAALMFSQDHDRLPTAQGWREEMAPYLQADAPLECPSVSEGGYAMNPGLADTRPLKAPASRYSSTLMKPTAPRFPSRRRAIWSTATSPSPTGGSAALMRRSSTVFSTNPHEVTRRLCLTPPPAASPPLPAGCRTRC